MVTNRFIEPEMNTLKGYARYYYQTRNPLGFAYQEEEFKSILEWLNANQSLVVDQFSVQGGMAFEFDKEGDELFQKEWGQYIRYFTGWKAGSE